MMGSDPQRAWSVESSERMMGSDPQRAWSFHREANA